jgi:hypothetical protein
MSGAGDCTKTEAWGRNWDWTRDWSVEWGKDFDKEWKDNKNDADAMRDRVEHLEDAIRKAANCSSASGQQQQSLTQVSDGSVATAEGNRTSNCTLAAANATDGSADDGAAPLPTGGRKLTARDAAPAVHISSSPVVAAWAAAKLAAQHRCPATELLTRPLQYAGPENDPAVPDWLEALSAQHSSQAAAQQAGSAQHAGDGHGELGVLADGPDPDLEFDWEFGEAAGGARHLSQVSLPGFINFDVGCWYCYYGKGEALQPVLCICVCLLEPQQQPSMCSALQHGKRAERLEQAWHEVHACV